MEVRAGGPSRQRGNRCGVETKTRLWQESQDEGAGRGEGSGDRAVHGPDRQGLGGHDRNLEHYPTTIGSGLSGEVTRTDMCF